MSLKDLMQVAKAKKSTNGFSLKQKIDEFFYRQSKDVADGKLTDRDVRLSEARIEYRLAKRKLRSWKQRDTHSRVKFFHPSSLGDCLKKFFYKYFNAPEEEIQEKSIEDTGKTFRIFANGDYFHWRMQVLMIRMGLAQLEDIEVPFEKDDLQGTCDAIITVNGEKVVVDFKTINDFGYKFTLKKELDTRYETQLRMYMKVFEINKGIVLYENKNDQSLSEIFLHRHQMEEDKYVNQRLIYIRKCLKRKEAPLKEGENLKRVPCTYCPYTKLCWNLERDKRWISNL